MSTTTSQHLSCPRCNAHVRAGSQWCTLCYCDLRPAPPVRDVAASPALDALVTPGSEDPAGAPVRRGKHARPSGGATATPGSAPAPGSAVADEEIERMLIELAAQTAKPLGRFAGRFDSRGSKIGLMVGGSVSAALVIICLMAVVGALL